MREILGTPDIAKVIGCSDQQVRYNVRHNVWNFARVVKRGKKRFYMTTISELADYFGLSRDEVIRRINCEKQLDTNNH